jgi:hypothetical protein
MDIKDQFIEWLRDKILSNPQEPPGNAWDQISNSLDLEESWQEIGKELELEDIWQKVDARLHQFEYLQLFERIGYAISGLAAIVLLLGIWWGSGPDTGLAEGEIAKVYELPAQPQSSTLPSGRRENTPKRTKSDSKNISAETKENSHSDKKAAAISAAPEEAGNQAPGVVTGEEGRPGRLFAGRNATGNKLESIRLLERKAFAGFRIQEPTWPAVVAEDLAQAGTINPEDEETFSASPFPAMVAGIGSAAKLSWLMNNKTLEALEKTSLVTAKPAVFTDVFITYGVRLSRGYMLQADGYLLDWSGQRYQEYREGAYGAVADRLLYRSLGLSLHKAGSQLGFGAMPVFNQLNAGVYAGALRNAEEASVTGVSSKLNEYKKWHFGLQAGYGYDVFLNKNLMLTYGVRGRLDLLNIYSGTSAIPASFRKTRNASLDFIMSLKYVLKK